MKFGLRGVKVSLRPKMTMKKVIQFALLALFAFSCLDEPDCFQLNNNVLTLTYKILGGANDQVPFICVQSPATDSVFNALTISDILKVPLDPTAEALDLDIQDFYADHSLALGYSRQVQFVSEECGERYYYSGVEVLSHDYDSIRIVNAIPQPEIYAATNIEIYRCPRTNLGGVQFKQIINSTEVKDTVVILNANVGFVTPIFIPNDTLQSINVPLNPDAASTTIQFTFNTPSGPVTKFVTVTYTRISKKLFERCGTQTLFTDLSVSASDFASTRILKDSLQDLPIINLEVIQ
jgi:hypothetical protein